MRKINVLLISVVDWISGGTLVKFRDSGRLLITTITHTKTLLGHFSSSTEARAFWRSLDLFRHHKISELEVTFHMQSFSVFPSVLWHTYSEPYIHAFPIKQLGAHKIIGSCILREYLHIKTEMWVLPRMLKKQKENIHINHERYTNNEAPDLESFCQKMNIHLPSPSPLLSLLLLLLLLPSHPGACLRRMKCVLLSFTFKKHALDNFNIYSLWSAGNEREKCLAVLRVPCT